MKTFTAGVLTTLITGVLLAWITDSVPTMESGRAAVARAMEASAAGAHIASTVMLILTCMCALGCVAYWAHYAFGQRREIGIVGGLGVGWLVVGVTVTFALAFVGLRAWSDASSGALPVIVGAVAVGSWTTRAVRRRWNALFRIA